MPGLPPSGRKKRGKRLPEREEKLNLNIVMNLICILIPVLLMQQVTDYFRHDVELPSRGGPAAGGATNQPTNPPFNLKLTVNDDNSLMIVNAKTLSPSDGLIQQGPGLVLPPMPDGALNTRQLQVLLAKEKEQRLGGKPPDAFPDPDQITISAPSDIEFQRIVRVLDAVRFKPGGDNTQTSDMFSVISLSPGSVGG